MTTIRFVEHVGREHVIDARDGESLMRTARDNGVPGVVAECGGNLSCSTCHGYIDPGFFDLLPPAKEDEQMLLEGTVDPKPNSRLTCQIIIEPKH
jgi:2Fe-2S ferredoxin